MLGCAGASSDLGCPRDPCAHGRRIAEAPPSPQFLTVFHSCTLTINLTQEWVVVYGTAFHVCCNPSLLPPTFFQCLRLISSPMSLLIELTNGLESLTHHSPDWDFLVRMTLCGRSHVDFCCRTQFSIPYWFPHPSQRIPLTYVGTPAANFCPMTLG